MTKKSRQRGFSLVEMMVAIIIFAVLGSIAVPSFRNAGAGNSLRGAASELVAALNTARTQAVNLRVNVQLSAVSGGNWSQGWSIAYPAGAPEEDQSFTISPDVTVTRAGSGSLTFQPDGFVSQADSFIVCDSVRAGEKGRKISVSRVGRISNEDVTCS
ncbi:MAG: general secretion pathway protein GspH [Alcanivorax sp.]|nr:MAG: general secretion pathway protein GspH [Alcanivorax sp.]